MPAVYPCCNSPIRFSIFITISVLGHFRYFTACYSFLQLLTIFPFFPGFKYLLIAVFWRLGGGGKLSQHFSIFLASEFPWKHTFCDASLPIGKKSYFDLVILICPSVFLGCFKKYIFSLSSPNWATITTADATKIIFYVK